MLGANIFGAGYPARRTREEECFHRLTGGAVWQMTSTFQFRGEFLPVSPAWLLSASWACYVVHSIVKIGLILFSGGRRVRRGR